MDFFALVLIFFVSIFASFISSMVGSGGLITIPFLIFLGLPAPTAIASHRVGSLGLQLGSLSRFWNENKINWKYILPFTIIDVVSAFVGAHLLVSADSNLLSKSLGFILLLLLPLSFFKKDFGTVSKNVSNQRKFLGVVCYFLAGIWGGFFGGGAGTLVYAIYVSFFGFTLIEAIATDKIPGFLSGLLAVVLFSAYGLIDYSVGFTMFFAMIIGSFLGAHMALQKGNVWLKALFGLIVLILALKLIFFN
ncbi:MAG: sulfite exporter TauE/SafE family protein [Candidatus Diapherotrites archaeon]|nr:sulfite exporter TauE/SafE family protein [Candidatus Diapherotrites archaeon]